MASTDGDGELLELRVGPYKLIEPIGVGGFTRVFRAEDHQRKDLCAVKVLRREFATDPYQVKALTAERDHLAACQHQGIPRVRDLIEVNKRPALVMDLVDGQSVYAHVRAGIGVDRVSLMVSMVSLVAHVHGCGIIHNDLKPENFLLGVDGRLRLIDFGNARKVNQGTGFFRRIFSGKARRVQGSPSYMAPELIHGEPPSLASDIYALGACAHFVLTDRPPHEAASTSGKLRAAIGRDAQPVTQRVRRIPKEFGDMVDACLKRDPQARPQDARHLDAKLKRSFSTGRYRKPKQLSEAIRQAQAASGSSTGSETGR